MRKQASGPLSAPSEKQACPGLMRVSESRGAIVNFPAQTAALMRGFTREEAVK